MSVTEIERLLTLLPKDLLERIESEPGTSKVGRDRYSGREGKLAFFRDLIEIIAIESSENLENSKLFFGAIVNCTLFEALDVRTKKTVRSILNISKGRVFFESMIETPIVLLKQLVGKYWGRKTRDIEVELDDERTVVYYVPYTKAEHEEEKKILQKILQNHNEMFRHQSDYFLNLDVDAGTRVVVRADVHGDLATVLALSNFLVSNSYLNKEYCARPDFHLVFLGDLMDRGPNEIEVLSFILLLRMINPRNVHIIRGNHENVGVQLNHSNEEDWIEKNEVLLETCYRTFPVALTITEKEGRSDKGGRKEKLLCTHGVFSTLVDLCRVQEAKMSAFQLDDFSLRLQKSLSEIDQSNSSGKKRADAIRVLLAAQKVEKELLQDESQYSEEGFFPLSSYVWSDISCGEKEGADSECEKSSRGHALCVPIKVIQAYFRCSNSASCVKALVRGHEHVFAEDVVYRVPKEGEASRDRASKVLVTTLPVAPAGGICAPVIMNESIQAVLFVVGRRMKEWVKIPLLLSERRRMILGKKYFGMYDCMGWKA